MNTMQTDTTKITLQVEDLVHLKAVLGSGRTLTIKSNTPSPSFKVFFNDFIKENKLRKVRWWEIWKSTDWLYVNGIRKNGVDYQEVFAVTTI